MREFESGATRDTVDDKLDLEGFLSPAVINRYAEYMNKHRKQSDGNLRDSDNWQKGIPTDVYMKSGYRHFFDWWANHRHVELAIKEDIEESLCGLLFNTMGYLHEHLKSKDDYNAVEIDGPYVFQSGDIVYLCLRSRIEYPQITPLLQETHYRGKVIKKITNALINDLYAVKLKTKEFNFYADEMTLLKKKEDE